MAAKILVSAMVAAMMLAGCAHLTAEAPLFSPADQIGPAPLTEGIWIAIGDDCPARMATTRGRLPKACSPSRLSRLEDGAWLLGPAQPSNDPEQAAKEKPVRVIVAPATNHPSPDAFAPLYLGEYAEAGEGAAKPGYVIIVPVGVLPAREVEVVTIDCADILRDGPIEGVRETHEDGPGDHVTGCIAADQSAVREAVRRALVENAGHLADERLVFVRP